MDHFGNTHCEQCDRKFYPLEYNGKIVCPHCMNAQLTWGQKAFNRMVIVASIVGILAVVYVAYKT